MAHHKQGAQRTDRQLYVGLSRLRGDIIRPRHNCIIYAYVVCGVCSVRVCKEKKALQKHGVRCSTTQYGGR